MTGSEKRTKQISDRLTALKDEELVRIARLQLPYVTTAYEVLFHRYHRVLTQVCYRYLGTIEEAEEAVNDAMLNVFNRLEQFEERASFKTWIYKIAHNQSLNRLRKKQVEQVEFDELLHKNEQSSPYQLSSDTATLDFLLSKLSIEERSIVVFRLVGNLEFSEIATIVEQKLSAVKMRYKRALDKMTVDAKAQ